MVGESKSDKRKGRKQESDAALIIEVTAGTSCAKKRAERRSWTENECRDVLKYLLTVIQAGRELEKPTATAFYKAALEKLNLDNCSDVQLKNQVRNLKTKYGNALQWRNQTGQGVLEEEGEESVKSNLIVQIARNTFSYYISFEGVLLRKCPLFDELDEIYGERANFVPPHLYDSAESLVVNNTQEIIQEEANDDPGDLDLDINLNPAKNIETTVKSLPNTSLLGKRKHKVDSGISALAETVKLRYEMQKEEVTLQREKWIDEMARKDHQEYFQQKQYDDMQKIEERKLRLEERRIDNEMEVAKYKIDQEFKLKLELAKFQSNQ